MTDYASAEGKVRSIANPYGIRGNFSFNTTLNDRQYVVESPDALVPAGNDSYTIFRYIDNGVSAGVAYKGEYKVITLGFPIEALLDEAQIDQIIGESVKFFEDK
jgi:hypothetical protein